MSWMDRIQNAEVNGGGARFQEGDYLLRIDRIFEKRGHKGHSFIVEFSAVESNNPACPAGYSGGMVIMLDGKYPDLAAGDVKAFIAAANGLDPYSKEALSGHNFADLTAMALRPEQPMTGICVYANVWGRVSQNARPGDDPFMKFKFRPALDSHGRVIRKDPPTRATPPARTATAAPAPSPGAPSGGAYAPPAAPPAPPAAPPAPPAAPPFPPPGWVAHPSAPGWYWNQSTNDVLSESDLRNTL